MARLDEIRVLLESEPQDSFLRYALGVELVKVGQVSAGLAELAALHVDQPDFVAAYFRRAQILLEEGDAAGAREAAEAGIVVARRVGDSHAAAEMTAFLDLVD